jgi:hypothetical protein
MARRFFSPFVKKAKDERNKAKGKKAKETESLLRSARNDCHGHAVSFDPAAGALKHS